VTSIPALVPGQPWPPLFIEGSAAATNNSAADYATYYWVTDLRSSGATAKNNVPGGDSDPATWQHLNFAALSLGTEGKLAAGNQADTEKQLAAGSLEWSQPFPTVNKPDESGVDDLWHAAINGHGRFVNAKSADELRAGMGAILADIANQPGTRAGAGLTGVKLSGTSNYVYRVGFDKGWSGSLIKVRIDSKTGKETPIWNAADQLTTQVTKSAAVPEPWFTNRRVVTRDETGKAVPFLWDSLPNLQDSFAPGKPTRGKALVAYLRGSSTNEGTETGKLRPRVKTLGDIVNSSPVYVGAPNFPYKETNDPGYPAWKASVSRPAMIYVGANDGMLHAIDDATGNESWAYVPSALYRKPDPPESVGATYPNLLGALAFQEGALPKFKHRFLVDGPITVTDADIDGSWKTMLVGGLGKGGKSFYAVDITNPANVKTEADAAAALMWEFSDPDLGYSFGKPLVTKTNAFGKKWLVIVSSGYNNASGEGKLWFLDAKDGTVLKVLSTGAGSSGTPSGLAQFSAYTQDQTNYLADQIYAGDLLGNFWRFDVSDANSANWKVEKMATLTSPSGAAQPVTTAPQIEIDITNGIDRWVFVGTGRLLHENDLPDTAVQTLYAFRDGTAVKPGTITGAKSRGDLIAVTDADGAASRPDKGWYDDLPTSPPGQRIVVAPAAALSVVAYLATYPSTDPCVTGLPATLYAREFSRGNSLLLDSGGNIVESVDLPDGGVGLDILALEKDSASSSTDPNLVIRVEGADKSKEGTIVKIKGPELLGAHRMSWRLIGD
jgi:type IV pilus assembly protein PilY1